jgi:hypothetical protein
VLLLRAGCGQWGERFARRVWTQTNSPTGIFLADGLFLALTFGPLAALWAGEPSLRVLAALSPLVGLWNLLPGLGLHPLTIPYVPPSWVWSAAGAALLGLALLWATRRSEEVVGDGTLVPDYKRDGTLVPDYKRPRWTDNPLVVKAWRSAFRGATVGQWLGALLPLAGLAWVLLASWPEGLSAFSKFLSVSFDAALTGPRLAADVLAGLGVCGLIALSSGVGGILSAISVEQERQQKTLSQLLVTPLDAPALVHGWSAAVVLPLVPLGAAASLVLLLLAAVSGSWLTLLGVVWGILLAGTMVGALTLFSLPFPLVRSWLLVVPAAAGPLIGCLLLGFAAEAHGLGRSMALLPLLFAGLGYGSYRWASCVVAWRRHRDMDEGAQESLWDVLRGR